LIQKEFHKKGCPSGSLFFMRSLPLTDHAAHPFVMLRYALHDGFYLKHHIIKKARLKFRRAFFMRRGWR